MHAGTGSSCAYSLVLRRIPLFSVPPHKRSVIITLVPADIIKLRYEVTYNDEKHAGFDVSSSIMKLKRTTLPVNANYLQSLILGARSSHYKNYSFPSN